jgi:5-formyltetrahydrofolate cyclo-ligase
VNRFPEPSARCDSQLARRALRARLLAERDAFMASGDRHTAAAALGEHLRAAIVPLRPTCLGLYWPIGSEFDIAAALMANRELAEVARAIPYARRSPRTMEFRIWDCSTPAVRDECGIVSTDGPLIVPDVVVAPCVGFTLAGHRLGYGGGYYDRWLAGHPHVLAVGLAWSVAELDLLTFEAQWHDIPLAFVVTERGVLQNSSET